MTDYVVIHAPGIGALALTREQLKSARAAAIELLPSTSPPANTPTTEPLLTAEQAEQATGVPRSWFAEQARRGTVPCVRFGHYVRFRLSSLIEALERRPDAGIGHARITRPQLVESPRKGRARRPDVAQSVTELATKRGRDA